MTEQAEKRGLIEVRGGGIIRPLRLNIQKIGWESRALINGAASRPEKAGPKNRCYGVGSRPGQGVRADVRN